ncbi:hypothetical protein QTL95_21450 [Rhizobium sp. S152]|uniref:hypothetical protein n=1 Tax=Rhizobium sp. S152 TaxID=3055038 RepID=UPI0025A9EA7D|nr:hypothetical protein [Rhizobium sp. S152]MDM9628466.1 hypothetical protein [Rhizobium sp. S152]
MVDSEPAVSVVSEAVRNWFEYYDVTPDDSATEILGAAGIDFYNRGIVTIQAITSALIETFVGRMAVHCNAPTSIAIH